MTKREEGGAPLERGPHLLEEVRVLLRVVLQAADQLLPRVLRQVAG